MKKVILLMTIIVIASFFIISRISLRCSNSPTNNSDSQAFNAKREEKIDLIIDQAIHAQLEHPAKMNEDIVDEAGNSIGLGTTPDHWKELGIENAKIPEEEENKLYQIIAKATKAELRYSASKKEEFLDGVMDLYLPEKFEQYKKDSINDGGYYASGGIYHAPTDELLYLGDIKTIRFSKPRTYKDLSDRIGVINNIEFNDSDANSLTQIFIFKNVNGEWKIEKQVGNMTRFDVSENNLIGELRTENKK